MDNRIISDLLRSYKNFVFIGEAGSGKTEFGINMAMAMAEEKSRKVHFFDMDQTKPLFRARDVGELMEKQDIIVHSQKQFQDIPTMVPGIVESLNNPDEYTLIDVGGNVHGALMVGQLAASINNEQTCVFFIINVYRPWSGNALNIAQTKASIMAACRVASVRLISNPTFGPTTTAEEIVEGNRRLKEILGDDSDIDYICVTENLVDELPDLGKGVIPIHPYIRMT